ncbi:MAG: DUF3006 domain-containing protein, partial [Candidatus Margulisiibacteriota bacterium]
MAKLQAIIDRFEGQLAVLLVGQDETKLEVPRQLLPDGTEEGDIITLEMKRAPAKTAKAKADVAAM